MSDREAAFKKKSFYFCMLMKGTMTKKNLYNCLASSSLLSGKLFDGVTKPLRFLICFAGKSGLRKESMGSPLLCAYTVLSLG